MLRMEPSLKNCLHLLPRRGISLNLVHSLPLSCDSPPPHQSGTHSPKGQPTLGDRSPVQDLLCQVTALSHRFRFQENIDRQPVAQTLVQPFLYIEKVIKKQTVDQKLADMKHP